MTTPRWTLGTRPQAVVSPVALPTSKVSFSSPAKDALLVWKLEPAEKYHHPRLEESSLTYQERPAHLLLPIAVFAPFPIECPWSKCLLNRAHYPPTTAAAPLDSCIHCVPPPLPRYLAFSFFYAHRTLLYFFRVILCSMYSHSWLNIPSTSSTRLRTPPPRYPSTSRFILHDLLHDGFL